LSPFEQLLAVLPPQSANLLPSPLSLLMTDPESEISHFYVTRDDLNHDNLNTNNTDELPNIDITCLQHAYQRIVTDNADEMHQYISRRNTFQPMETFIKKKNSN
jgi:5'-3' exoribonuclease 1